MSTVSPAGSMTLEQFWELPQDDGIDRELIRGELKERPMTKRNRFHSAVEASIVYLIKAWVLSQPVPKGQVYSGEVGCILRRDPPTNVGIDVAYFSAETVDAQTDGTTMLDGVPILAVEILSPSDKQEEVADKIDVYLESGVKVVWIVDPRFKTVTVHRGDTEPQLFNVKQSLNEQPQMLNFDVAVKELFE